MKVILKKTSEIKNVSFGYAVNYLLPKGLAEIATEKKIKLWQQKQKEKNKQLKAREKEDQGLAKKLDNKNLIFPVKVGKTKKIFGSITKKDIIQALNVDPRRVEIELEKPIKKLGKHQIELKIGNNRARIKLKLEKAKTNEN